MRHSFWILSLFIALAACTDDGKLAGDDLMRNDESPGEGPPVESNSSARERSTDPRPDQERAYATDSSTEQTTAAPPDPK